jgi:hypothetical protein
MGMAPPHEAAADQSDADLLHAIPLVDEKLRFSRT